MKTASRAVPTLKTTTTNGDPDAGGDETIFDGGDAGIIVQKTIELRHDLISLRTEIALVKKCYQIKMQGLPCQNGASIGCMV
jgi:hypothetical protein